jgi:hypothetical protein
MRLEEGMNLTHSQGEDVGHKLVGRLDQAETGKRRVEGGGI